RHSTALIFSFFAIRRSHISTLCPYTTLFRSPRSPPVAIAGDDAAAPAGDQAARAVEPRTRGLSGRGARRQSAARHRLRRRRRGGDRKSTRLNSSHVKISYAVFCLKKKYLRKQ